jgi:hypothetical protein
MRTSSTLTKEEQDLIHSLRSRGFAVIIWSPEELGNASAKLMQTASIELGYEIIDEANLETVE